jgi:hypothetical protein
MTAVVPADGPNPRLSDPRLFVPLSHFRCANCRSPRVTFVSPGWLEERSQTGILVKRGQATRCACWDCREQGKA